MYTAVAVRGQRALGAGFCAADALPRCQHTRTHCGRILRRRRLLLQRTLLVHEIGALRVQVAERLLVRHRHVDVGQPRARAAGARDRRRRRGGLADVRARRRARQLDEAAAELLDAVLAEAAAAADERVLRVLK